MMANNHVYPLPNLTTSSELCSHQTCTWYTQIDAGKQKVNENLKTFWTGHGMVVLLYTENPRPA